VLLQGTLKEYPLEDLLTIFAEHKETGRLDVTLPADTAQVYLQEGRPVDCCIGRTQGVEALNELLSQTEGVFHFMSCVAPPNLNFRNGKDDHDLSTLLRERERQAKLASVMSAPAVKTRKTPPPRSVTPLATPLAAVPHNERRYKAVAAAVMVLATITAVIGLRVGAGISNNRVDAETEVQQAANAAAAAAVTLSTPTPEATLPALPPLVEANVRPVEKSAFDAQHSTHKRAAEISTERKEGDFNAQKKTSAQTVSIPVVLRIEDGRVVEAYPAEHRAGWDAYEATAVRLACQRRFNNKTSTETLVLTITGN